MGLVGVQSVLFKDGVMSPIGYLVVAVYGQDAGEWFRGDGGEV